MVPQLPGPLLDGGVPGFCERTTDDSHEVRTYDDQGRVVTDERFDSRGSSFATTTYDACGNVARIEVSSDAGTTIFESPTDARGLPAGYVRLDPQGCTVVRQVAQTDDADRLWTLEYVAPDGGSLGTTVYTYGADGRLAGMDSGSFTTEFDYRADGGLARYAYVDESRIARNEWNEAGQPTRREVDDMSNSTTWEWRYDAGTLVASSVVGSGYCGDGSTFTSYDYDGGTLSREVAEWTAPAGCASATQVSGVDTTVFTNTGSTTVAETTRADAGLQSRVTTQWDARGNPLRVETRTADGGLSTVTQSYDCVSP